jgi:hypothetical protein
VALARGDLGRAITLFEEVLVRYRAADSPWGLGNALAQLAWVMLEQDELVRVALLLAEALAVRRAIADTPGLADCLEGAVAVAGKRGRWGDAAQLAGAASALREAADLPAPPDERAIYERHLLAARAQADEAMWTTAWAEGRAMPLDEALALAEAEFAAAQDA